MRRKQLAIVAAIIGGVVSYIGFYYKNRKEIKENINESFFHLFQIWAFLAQIKIMDGDNLSNFFIKRFKVVFPHEVKSKSDIDLLKESIRNAPQLDIFRPTGQTVGDLLLKYNLSILNLAKIYPMLAISLAQNEKIFKILEYVDMQYSN